jgi:lysyl endopeptidase
LVAYSHQLGISSHDFALESTDSLKVYSLELAIHHSFGPFSWAFQKVKLPQGAIIKFLNPAGELVYHKTVHPSEKAHAFLTPFLFGNKFLVRIEVPTDSDAFFELSRVYVHFEQENGATRSSTGFGASWPCHINTACPQGASLTDQQDGTCRIVMAYEEGIGYCSGTLVNNALQDGKPYVLSAFHCQYFNTPIFELWRFDFLYASETCDNPSEEPPYHSIYGCDYIAGRLESDFLLVELHDSILPEWKLFFNGWNRSLDSIPSSGSMLHHPRGDIMKVSLENDPLMLVSSIINWGNGVITPPNHHIRAFWDEGTSEPGSSGAALWNSEKHIVGQLHGGSANCENVFRANFGRFAMSWNQGQVPEERLSEWLDPENSGMIKLDGMFLPLDTATFTISWKVLTADGLPIVNLFQELVWPDDIEFTDHQNGDYQLKGFKRFSSISFTPEKNDLWSNGVDGRDVRAIASHIDGRESIQDPFALIAADINQDSKITGQDLHIIFAALRGSRKTKHHLERWIFIPDIIDVNDIQDNLDLGTVIGLKPGDVNFDRRLD